MSPLIKRQYEQRTFRPSDELRRVRLSRYSSIGKLPPPRKTPSAELSPIGAHTDAQGRGHIAAAVLPREPITASLHLPHRFCALGQNAEGVTDLYL